MIEYRKHNVNFIVNEPCVMSDADYNDNELEACGINYNIYVENLNEDTIANLLEAIEDFELHEETASIDATDSKVTVTMYDTDTMIIVLNHLIESDRINNKDVTVYAEASLFWMLHDTYHAINHCSWGDVQVYAIEEADAQIYAFREVKRMRLDNGLNGVVPDKRYLMDWLDAYYKRFKNDFQRDRLLRELNLVKYQKEMIW